MRMIAKALRRNPSTICRELQRNGDRHRYYDPHLANVFYWRRRERCMPRHKTGNSRLMAYVRRKLKALWSPEQIAGRLRHVDQPDNGAMWISHETIYRYVWAEKAQGGTLYRRLRRGRKKYGKRGTGPHPNKRIRGRISIEERPEIVDKQGRFGDWEGDTVYGRYRKGCMATLVERKSLYLLAGKMPDATAQSLNDTVTQVFQDVPRNLIHTLTVDNGKEVAAFKHLEEALEANVYFTHPYSAWERPINENTNGLLRQFLPKKYDLRRLTARKLTQIIQWMNDRPRKKLNYRTPSEVFLEQAVALES